MPKIKLYGKQLPRTTEVKLPQSRVDTSTITPPERNQKAAFAHMRELEPTLQDISADDIWEYLKNAYGGVSSRTEFTQSQWSLIAARLYAAKTHARLRADLNDAVRSFKDATTNDTVQ